MGFLAQDEPAAVLLLLRWSRRVRSVGDDEGVGVSVWVGGNHLSVQEGGGSGESFSSWRHPQGMQIFPFIKTKKHSPELWQLEATAFKFASEGYRRPHLFKHGCELQQLEGGCFKPVQGMEIFLFLKVWPLEATAFKSLSEKCKQSLV